MGNKSSGVCSSSKNQPSASKQNTTSVSPTSKKITLGRKASIPQSKLDRVPVTKSLNLAKFKYGSVPSNLFHINNLEIVNLNDNTIKCIEEDSIPALDDAALDEKQQNEDVKENAVKPNKRSKSSSKYKGIKILRLSNNRLSALPQSFMNLSNLQTLQLVGNRFEYFPSVLFRLANLKELSLRANQIQIVECSMQLAEGVKKLSDLDLSYNALQYLPDEFTYISSLTVVNLEHNELLKLPAVWSRMTKLHIINLRENNLNHIPQSLFVETGVVRIDLEDNPVHTSKKYIHLDGFEEFSKRHKKNWDKGDSMGADRANHTI